MKSATNKKICPNLFPTHIGSLGRFLFYSVSLQIKLLLNLATGIPVSEVSEYLLIRLLVNLFTTYCLYLHPIVVSTHSGQFALSLSCLYSASAHFTSSLNLQMRQFEQPSHTDISFVFIVVFILVLQPSMFRAKIHHLEVHI